MRSMEKKGASESSPGEDSCNDPLHSLQVLILATSYCCVVRGPRLAPRLRHGVGY
jgi:hypothetical protein